jgi:hypothetical protein
MGFPGSVLLNQGDVFAQTSDKRHPLGTRGYTRDGRVYRYARAGGTNLEVGKLMQMPAHIVNWDKNLHPSSIHGSSVSTNSTYVYVHFRVISTGTLPTSANVVADGYLIVNDGTGQGQYVQIASNTASTSTLAKNTCRTKVVFREGEHLTARLAVSSGWGASGGATGSQVGLIRNPYDKVIVSAKHATGTGIVLGVTPRAVTANYYFWLQTWGPAVCLCDTAATIGYAAVRSATDIGAYRQNTTLDVGITQPQIGQMLQTGVDTEYEMINLNLAP